MTALDIKLLGRPFLRHGETELTSTLSQKGQALLYYLAVTRHAHSRESLAGLLWSDLPEENARRNLRVELARCRKLLPDSFDAQRRTVAFNLASNFSLDITPFEQAIQQPSLTIAELETAVSLYRGTFLDGFHPSGAALFAEWQTSQQERLRQLAIDGYQQLIQQQSDAGQIEAGIGAARRLLTIEPWLEAAHRHLMRLLALNGQRAAALAQYEQCATALMEELGVNPAPETDALYDQIEAGELKITTNPPTHQSANQPTSYPPPFQPPPLSSSFVGRASEIATLQERLTGSNGRSLVAIVGMGGSGKSTLAAQMAHQLRDQFADGVLWADLATSEPHDILLSWGQAFGYDFSGLKDVNSRAAALRTALADKRLLFGLDDVAQASLVEPLLPNGAGCAVLLTTRSLDVAHALNAEVLQLGELTAENGRELLATIMGEVRVRVEVEAADEICALLHYLPLAIEITAQRLKSRPRRKLTDMAKRLRDTSRRLGLGISDRAVRASFEVSWQALDEEQQAAFCALGVFAERPFTVEAVAHVAELDEFDAEDHLFALAALSLLKEEGETHFRLHPLLADFASEKLGDATLPEERMAHFFQQFAEENAADFERLKPEWGNLMAGMQVAHQQDNWPLLLAYANVLIEPWKTRARYSEMRRGLAWAKAAAEQLGDEEAIAQMLLHWGEACIEQNDYGEAAVFLNDSLTRFHQIEEGEGIAEAQYQLARVAIEEGNYQAATKQLEQAYRIQETLQNKIGMAAALYRQARILLQKGTYGPASELAKRALVMQTEEGEQLALIRTQRLWALIESEQKNYRNAAKLLEETLRLSQSLNNLPELAATLSQLADVYRRHNQLSEAAALAEESIQHFARMGDRKLQGIALYRLSIIKESELELELALQYGLESRTLLESANDQFGLIFLFVHLGDLYLGLNQVVEAKQFWESALSQAEAQSHPAVDTLKGRLATL